MGLEGQFLKFLKAKNKNIQIVAVEPEDSSVIAGVMSPRYSRNWCRLYSRYSYLNIVDKVLSISNSSAFEYSRKLAKVEGIAEGYRQEQY